MQVTSLSGEAAAPALNSACLGSYQIVGGDTLGKISQACGIPLRSLISANPQIENPNRVFAGQWIHIPDLAGRGGGEAPDGALVTNSGSFSPGSKIEVQIMNMPANATVRIGLGLSRTGFQVLQTSQIGPDGVLTQAVVIPLDAIPGDSAFVLVSAVGVPSVQVISPEFRITP